MKVLIAAMMLLFSTTVLGQESVIELTKQEALDLVVARDQVEEAMLTLQVKQEQFNELLSGIFGKYQVSTDAFGWRPTTGQLVPLKQNEQKDNTTTTVVEPPG